MWKCKECGEEIKGYYAGLVDIDKKGCAIDGTQEDEELVEYKMSKKNLSLEEAYKDIIETAGKTNKEVNKKFNLD